MTPTPDETLIHLKYIRDVLGEMKNSIQALDETVQKQNGRVRQLEIAVAVLKWAGGVFGIVALYLLTELIRGKL